MRPDSSNGPLSTQVVDVRPLANPMPPGAASDYNFFVKIAKKCLHCFREFAILSHYDHFTSDWGRVCRRSKRVLFVSHFDVLSSRLFPGSAASYSRENSLNPDLFNNNNNNNNNSRQNPKQSIL
jgi:hypothetical protein